MGQKQEWEQLYPAIRANIFNLCNALKFKPTKQQYQLFKTYQEEHTRPPKLRKRRIAAKSGQGTGKTTGSCIIGMHRMLLDVGAMTVITAPTMRQCKDVWIAEFRRLLENAHPIMRKYIKVYDTSIQICEIKEWGAKCVTATRPENMQGYHQKYLTFLLEEASGIGRPIWQQIKGTLSNENSMLLAIGNPNLQACEFFDCFTKNRHLWHTMTFNAEESEIVSKDNIRLIEEEYGKDSDVYRVRVLGEFPHADPRSILSLDDVEYCCTQVPYLSAVNDPRGRNHDGSWGRQIGIDLARFGSDESVIAVRSGLSTHFYKAFSKVEPSHIIDFAFRIQADLGWKDQDVTYVIDAGGMGQGVFGPIYDAGKKVHEFHTQGKSTNTSYMNKMTEAWFSLAKLVKARAVKLPNDQRLIQQLVSRQYITARKDGKLMVEPKEDYIKRAPLGEDTCSPDRADALVMAYYPETMAVTQVGLVR